MDAMRFVGAGLITADIIIECDSLWVPMSGQPIYRAGGTVGNILSHLAWLRAGECYVLGGVGEDELGQLVRKDFDAIGVNTAGLRTIPGESTRRIGEQIVTSEGNSRGRHKFFETCIRCRKQFKPFPVSSYDSMAPLIESLVGRRTVLIIDRANDFTLSLARRVKAGGGINIFEPGYLSRNAVNVEALLDCIDLLKYSEELQFLGKPFKEHPLSKLASIKLVIETRGSTGVIARRANREIRLTTTPILEVVDSVGAGDAFMAGFLEGVGERGLFDLDRFPDSDLERALERGQAFGGLACLFIGARGIQSVRVEEFRSAITRVEEELRPPSDFGQGGKVERPGSSIVVPAGHCAICLQ